MMKLKPFSGKQALSEIFQSLDMKFSFVNRNKQVSMPAKCRDFLGDCIWSRVQEEPVNIYGFQYDYKKTPYMLSKTKLSIKFPNKATKANFMSHLEYLHEKEKKAKVTLTNIIETDDKDVVVVEGSKHWQEHPWKLSLYTFYLKVMSMPDTNNISIRPEKGYWKNIQPKEDLLLSLVKKTQDYTWSNDIYSQHNNTGVISMLNKYNNILSGYGVYL